LPLKYKIPGYLGNALLLILGLIVAGTASVIAGILMAALAVLNLYLVYKLDSFSREEVWLAHELEVTKMREQLIAAKARIGELETAPGTSPPHPQPPA
jgi:hypothetical protein